MENKTGKYLKYAIGEIVLVVIGILIALQVNNLNEQRKERVLEKSILNEILMDLRINRSDLEGDIEIEKQCILQTKELLYHLSNAKPKNDSILSNLIGGVTTSLQFSPRTFGRQSMQSTGVNIISNQELKNLILYTYDLRFEQMILEGREYEKFNNPSIEIIPFAFKYSQIDTSKTSKINIEDINLYIETYGLSLKNYDEMLKDNKFHVTLQKSIYNRADRLSTAYRTLRVIDSLEQSIYQELKK